MGQLGQTAQLAAYDIDIHNRSAKQPRRFRWPNPHVIYFAPGLQGTRITVEPKGALSFTNCSPNCVAGATELILFNNVGGGTPESRLSSRKTRPTHTRRHRWKLNRCFWNQFFCTTTTGSHVMLFPCSSIHVRKQVIHVMCRARCA